MKFHVIIIKKYIKTDQHLKDNKMSFGCERIKWGLYKRGIWRLINADVNGSYNIMRKEVGNVVVYQPIEGSCLTRLKLVSIKINF